MADEKLSRRNFLSGIGATAAASALPLSEIRSLMVRPEEPRPDAAAGSFDIAIESDLRGNLLGTVSRDAGKTPVIGAIVEIHGDSPLGVWTRQCRSDAQGFFQAPSPLGSRGEITVVVNHENAESHHVVSAVDLPQRLTPVPENAADRRLSLDGEWDFAVDPPAEFPGQGKVEQWDSIRTPSNWEMEDFVAKTGVAAFRKKLDIPASWREKRIKLRAEAIYSHAVVWLNRVRVGAHDGGTTSFEIDLTDAAKPGAENELVIIVHSISATTSLDKISFYSYWNIAGIWRPLELFAVEPAHVSRFAVNADFLPESHDGRLSLEIDLDNESPVEFKQVQLAAQLHGPDNKPVILHGMQSSVTLGPWQRKTVRLSCTVLNIQQWNAETPNLYATTLRIQVGQQAVEEIRQNVGFRRIEIRGRQYLFNGQPVKFLGTCYLPVHPLKGRAIDREQYQQDFAMLKETNINALRFTVLTPSSTMLELADREGMYVEEEAPFCWNGSDWFGKGVPHIDTSDLRTAPLYLRILSEVIERDRNHICVSLWSIGNESSYGHNFVKMRELAHRIDPSRPVSFALQTKDVDVATFHNPLNLPRLKLADQLPTPVLWDEALCNFQSGQSKGEGLELDPGLRDYWVVPHPAMLSEVRKREQLIGALIWAWIDDTVLLPGRYTHYWRTGPLKPLIPDTPYRVPGRGITGDFMWGTVDGWRRPRPEYFLTKKLYTPIFIEDKPLELSSPSAPIRIQVENRNAFRNLDRYCCEWSLGGQHGMVSATVPPLSSGVLEIPASPQPESELVLRFKDEKQHVIDSYRLSFVPRTPPAWQLADKPAELITNSLIYLSETEEIRLRGEHSDLFVDALTGALLGGLASGRQVLLDGPALHVLNNEFPFQDSPAGWKCEKVDAYVRERQAVIRKLGNYGDLYSGYFDHAMDCDGNLEFSYRFTYTGPKLNSREIGLVFDLPRDSQRISWDRNAEYSDYPEDHIGRPKGSALAHPPVEEATLTKDRPFALDDHSFGCNDFRSTKRNIYWASLTSSDGSGIEIISDGTQHIRARVGNFSIRLHVNDYFGGSSVGTSEWDDLYGDGRALQSGDVLQGLVRLRFLPKKA